jgi:hypothetical protein
MLLNNGHFDEVSGIKGDLSQGAVVTLNDGQRIMLDQPTIMMMQQILQTADTNEKAQRGPVDPDLPPTPTPPPAGKPQVGPNQQQRIFNFPAFGGAPGTPGASGTPPFSVEGAPITGSSTTTQPLMSARPPQHQGAVQDVNFVYGPRGAYTDKQQMVPAPGSWVDEGGNRERYGGESTPYLDTSQFTLGRDKNFGMLKKYGKPVPFQSLLKDDPTFQIYPELANTQVKITVLGDGATDGTQPDTEHAYSAETRTEPGGGKSRIEVFVNSPSINLNSLFRTLMHEGQHVIQEHDAMERGGSMTLYPDEEPERYQEYLKMIDTLTKATGPEGRDAKGRLLPDVEAMIKETAGYKTYHQIAGEQQAYAAQMSAPGPPSNYFDALDAQQKKWGPSLMWHRTQERGPLEPDYRRAPNPIDDVPFTKYYENQPSADFRPRYTPNRLDTPTYKPNTLDTYQENPLDPPINPKLPPKPTKKKKSR